MLLYILRHGDPIYNPDTLTEKGKLQAKALAERLAVHGLDRVYCSPHGRARETAQPTCEKLGLEMQIEDWTAEKYAWADFAVPILNGGAVIGGLISSGHEAEGRLVVGVMLLLVVAAHHDAGFAQILGAGVLVLAD